ncbi:alpha/beta hydrolase [Rhodococcoides kyotonense]|nr:alpha/beta hydrolase [Rhodococcus kyotonensis]
MSWGDVQRWDPADLSVLAHRVRAQSRILTGRIDDVTVLLEQLDWHGTAADAARTSLSGVQSEFLDRARVLDDIGRCVYAATRDMYPLVHAVQACEGRANEWSMTIEDDATVRDGIPVYASAAVDAWSIARDRLRCRRDIEQRARELLSRADDLDRHTAEALLQSEVEPRPMRPAAVEVPTSGSPAANAAFWDASTQAQRTALLVQRPDLLGGLDGIPAQIRDAANRRVLTLERTRLQGVAVELRKRLDDNIFGGMFDNADAGLAQTEKRLAALDAISETLAQGDRQLLVLDNHSADDTLAAIAVGNVDTATHVAVFVPGLDSDVQGDMRRYDGDMDSLKELVQQSVPKEDGVAVVTWMDYAAPHTGWSLLDPNRSVVGATAAVTGAARLSVFLDGLDASRRTDPHLSLLGHSYGSLTAAHAVRDAEATGVDELVAVGSPGLGVGTVHELSVPAGHVFVGEARNDVVADLGAFGTDPSELDGVRTLPTAAAGDLRAPDGHGQYFAEGTTTQDAIARVVAGLGQT